VAIHVEAAPAGGMQETESVSDAALMEQLVRREEGALRQLYDRYGRVVYSLVLRITRHAPAAEEIVQDVFLQLWRNAHRYEAARGRLEPWLFTLARNRALDFLRLKSEKQRRREDTLDLPLVPAGAALDAETMVDHNRRAERVRQQISGLPEKARRCIELAFFDGLTHSEIAQALDEPLGTVKSWIRTGLLQLRAALEGRP
jgi:RNA polymerase sigma-70 factor (ECF subfamily)